MAESNISHHHIVPLKIYLAVAAALLVLTAITVAVSFVHLGSLNIVIALLIAGIKASLVLLFFMHLRYEWNMNAVTLMVAVVFLVIFITFTMFDIAERGDTSPEMRNSINKNAAIYDASGKPLKATEHGEHADSAAAGAQHEEPVAAPDSSGH